MYRDSKIKKSNQLRRLTKHHLRIQDSDREAFQRWLKSSRQSKTSQQTDLPSSQLRKKEDSISMKTKQLIAVIDTCSIVSNRVEFMNAVVRLKKIFPRFESPIKFVISVEVLRELDKCNRRSRGRKKVNPTNNNDNNVIDDDTSENRAVASCSGNNSNDNQPTSKHDSETSLPNNYGNIFVDDIVKLDKKKEIVDSPPRMFMRFLEEELRERNVLLTEFKPGSLGPNANMEIINSDDRILNCCLAAIEFINSLPHHPLTQVVLITEDNLFKSKATTLDVISYRWKEFDLKFKNFGLEHYVSTPLVAPQREPIMFKLGNNPWSYKPELKEQKLITRDESHASRTEKGEPNCINRSSNNLWSFKQQRNQQNKVITCDDIQDDQSRDDSLYIIHEVIKID